MANLRIKGDVSGYVDLAAPDVAGSTTIDLSKLLVADSSGNVGIGEASPEVALHVHDSSGAMIESPGAQAYLYMYANDRANNYDRRYIATENSGDFTIAGFGTGQWAKHLVINSSGNVGVGTATPTNLLHIKSAVNNGSVITLESTATDSYPFLRLKNDAREYQITNHGPLGDKYTIYDGTAGAHRFVIDTSGNVGIGTTSPDQKLTISNGNLGIEHTTGYGIYIGPDAAEFASFGSNASTIHIKGTDPSGGNVARAGAIRFQSGDGQDTTALYSTKGTDGYGTVLCSYVGDLKFSTGTLAGNKMVIKNGGNVGIGTDDPGAPLDFGVTSQNQQVIKLRRNSNSTTGLAITNDYGVRVFGPSDASTTGNLFEVGEMNVSDGTSFLGSLFNVQYNGNVSIGAGDTPSERLQIGGNIRAGNTGSTTSFDGGGNDRYIGVSTLNGGDAMFIAHASGYGVGYFGYEPTDDKLIIACDNGGGNNKIDFSLNAGTSANGATDNLTGVWGDPELRISSTAHMVHVRGDTADTGTAGGSKGLSIYTGGGTSCPIYFGSESDSAQKSMYMSGYWIYLRGHQNEGIRFVFSQGAGTAPRSDQYQFKYNSAYRPTGNTTWDGFSDARAKENVTNLTGALDTISQLRPVTFDWTDDYADTMNMFEMDTTDEKSYNHISVKENGYDLDRKTNQIGFIAQEFEEVFPKSITETEMQLGDTKVEDFKTVNYDHLIPVLTKAIQELKAENDALKARIEALEGQ